MTPTTALVWKEWRQARPYLLIGLGVFVGLPMVAGVEQRLMTSRLRFDFIAYPWLTVLGTAFAALTGVGVVTPDLRLRLQDFWTSRPVPMWQWVVVKYLTGLLTILACSVIPLVADAALRHAADAQARAALQSVPFLMAAIYSLAFACGCLIRRPAHAATVALAVTLLVYLAPVVLPPLRWVNVADFDTARLRNNAELPDRFTDWWQAPQLHFAAGLTALSLAAFIAAVVAVVRNWQIESGQKLIYGAVSTGLILLVGSAAYQLGTNLPVVTVVDLPADERVIQILSDPSGGGVIVTSVSSSKLSFARSFSATGNALQIGDRVPLLVPPTYAWSYVVGHRLLRLNYENEFPNSPIDSGYCDVSLQAVDVITGHAVPPLHLYRAGKNQPAYAMLFLDGDRLYVIGPRLIQVDLRAGKPLTIVSDDPFNPEPAASSLPWWGPIDRHFAISTFQVPGFSPEKRLAATFSNIGYVFAGDCCARGEHGKLTAYRLSRLTADTAEFDLSGEYVPTYLQQLVEPMSNTQFCELVRHTAYVAQPVSTYGYRSGLWVFDIAGTVRRVGHFQVPGFGIARPLPDGRTIVGGTKLWLVGPPKAGESR